MKVFSVCGITGSGKTTTIENIIAELCSRGYKVGSVKEIHYQQFAIDSCQTSNTYRHKVAGSQLVTARGYYETDILYQSKLQVREILAHYSGYDYVVMEGVDDIAVPTITTAHTLEDLAAKWCDYTFCVSGRIADEITSHKGIPAHSSLVQIKELVDLIEQKVYHLLPDFSPQCCTACGSTCAEFGKQILSGQADQTRCIAYQNIQLTVNGAQVPLVPFVQKVMRETILGLVGNLDGYTKDSVVEIKFR